MEWFLDRVRRMQPVKDVSVYSGLQGRLIMCQELYFAHQFNYILSQKDKELLRDITQQIKYEIDSLPKDIELTESIATKRFDLFFNSLIKEESS